MPRQGKDRNTKKQQKTKNTKSKTQRMRKNKNHNTQHTKPQINMILIRRLQDA